jgi:anti-sigma factor RsiW
MANDRTSEPVSELELHAFIDGELDPARTEEIAALLEITPELAERVAAFERDKARLAEIYAPVLEWKLPEPLVRAVSSPPARPGRVRPYLRIGALAAAAATILLAVWIGATSLVPDGDALVAQAVAARDGTLHPAETLAADTLTATERDALLSRALSMPLKIPDLGQYGYTLAAIDRYADRNGAPFVQLDYRDGAGKLFTIFLHHPTGTDRFTIFPRRQLSICVWENSDISTVMVGEMKDREMARIGPKAYDELSL